MKNNTFIAVSCLNNFGGIGIIDINDDFVVSAFDFGSGIKHKRKTKLFYNYSKDFYYFVRYGVKYKLDDFMRV